MATALAVGLVVLAPRLALADDAALDALKKGYELKKAGKCAEAMVFLRKSHEAHPSAKAVLNWAECEESAGKFLSARAHYLEGKRLAVAERQPELEAIAVARLEALGPRVPKVTFSVPDGATVSVDGDTLASLSDVSLDPGEHRVQVARDGFEPQTSTLSLTPGETRAVRLTLGQAKATSPLPPRPPSPEGPRPADGSAGSSPLRPISIVGMGVGLVTIGVGSVLAIGAKSDYDAATSTSCDPRGCDPAGLAAIDGARSRADVATALFVAGGVVTAASAVLFFTAKSSPVRARAAVGGLVVDGRF
jgi:hypothetical protein